MPSFDFRILLETVSGEKTSYISSSFVNTSDDLVLSSSQAWNRITGISSSKDVWPRFSQGMLSCSYQNQPVFDGEILSINSASRKFTDNTLLSSSLSGSLSTGSICFHALHDEYDKLLRYKFIGEKVCNVLGLPSNQWIYVQKFRRPVEENTYIKGNLNADNVFISDTLTLAADANVNSDIAFHIDTGSDRHIKFIDERSKGDVGLFMGYDADEDAYELAGSEDITFNINNVNRIVASYFVTSESVVHTSSGSTVFGNSTDDKHYFTGSVYFKNMTYHDDDIKFSQYSPNGHGIISTNATGDDNLVLMSTNTYKGVTNTLTLGAAGNVITTGVNQIVFRVASDNNTNTPTDDRLYSMVITGSADNKALVGIGGNRTPSKTLTVSGDISSSGDSYLSSGQGSDVIVGSVNRGNTLVIERNSDAVPGGLIGVGSADRDIPESMYFGIRESGGASKVRMVISSSGYVGIGGGPTTGAFPFLTNPVPKTLTVEGDISASNNLFVSNSHAKKVLSVGTAGSTGGGWLDMSKATTDTSTLTTNYTDLSVTERNITIESPDPTIRIAAVSGDRTPKLDFVRGDYEFSGADNYTDYRLLNKGGHFYFQNKRSGYSDGKTQNVWTVNANNLSVLIGSGSGTELAPSTMATSSLVVIGDISGSELFLRSDDNPLITLERNSDQNVGIQFKNTQGTMVVGMDNDAHNNGANVFGIGYAGDIIDSDGDNNATFVVTGSQVVINQATTASIDATLTVGGSISATNHITSSGNIVASSTDPRIRVEATTGNHPGFEWLEAGSRKWITYNDPDSSQGGNDNLTWKNASDTELMELDQDGMLYVSSKIIHLDDTDTFINFTADDINLTVADKTAIDITWDGTGGGDTREITFNEGHEDLDVRIEGDTDTDLFFTNAGTDRVGVGTNSPSSKLQVDGDITATHITASGDISASGGYFGATIHTTGSFGSLANGESSGGDIIRQVNINGDLKGQVVYHTGGDWRPADKDTEGKVANLLGVALGNDGTFDVLVRGFVRLASGGIADSGGDEGDPVYLADDGTVKFAPSTTSGDFNKIVGYCINEADDIIWFDPDKTWVEVS